jgi:hypothetical protein
MPLQSIIVVFLRLFAVQFLFSFLVSALSFFRYSPISVSIVGAIIWLGACGVTWFLAAPLARLVTKGYDTTVSLGGLTRQDLYCFAFVFVGLGSFIGGASSSLMNLNTILSDQISPMMHGITNPITTQAIQQLPRNITELLLGLVALLFASRWAKKLASREESF